MGSSNTAGSGAGGGKKFQTLRGNPVLPTLHRQISGGSGFITGSGGIVGNFTVTIPADCVAGDEVFLFVQTVANSTATYASVTTPTGWHSAGGQLANMNPNGTNLAAPYAFRVVVTASGANAPGTTHTVPSSSMNLYCWVMTILRPAAGSAATPLTRTAAAGSDAGQGIGAVVGTSSTANVITTTSNAFNAFGVTGYRGLHLLAGTIVINPSNNTLTAAQHAAASAGFTQVRGAGSGIDRVSDPVQTAQYAPVAAAQTTGNGAGCLIAMAVQVVQSDNISAFSTFGLSWTQPATPIVGTGQLFPFSHISYTPGLDARVSINPLLYAKSPWQQVYASTQFPSTDLLIELTPRTVQAASTASTLLLDIGVGPAGAEVVLAADLGASDVALAAAQPSGPIRLALPIRIPAGSRVSVRGYLESTGSVPPYTVNATLIG